MMRKLRLGGGNAAGVSLENQMMASAAVAQMSPCAACKLLRRRCTPDCIFAPYFPAHQPHKFASVHKVFGASNVNKMLQVIANPAISRSTS